MAFFQGIKIRVIIVMFLLQSCGNYVANEGIWSYELSSGIHGEVWVYDSHWCEINDLTVTPIEYEVLIEKREVLLINESDTVFYTIEFKSDSLLVLQSYDDHMLHLKYKEQLPLNFTKNTIVEHFLQPQ